MNTLLFFFTWPLGFLDTFGYISMVLSSTELPSSINLGEYTFTRVNDTWVWKMPNPEHTSLHIDGERIVAILRKITPVLLKLGVVSQGGILVITYILTGHILSPIELLLCDFWIMYILISGPLPQASIDASAVVLWEYLTQAGVTPQTMLKIMDEFLRKKDMER